MAPSLINRTMSMLHCVTKAAVMWIGERAPVVVLMTVMMSSVLVLMDSVLSVDVSGVAKGEFCLCSAS